MHNITEIISERLIGQYKDSPVILALLNSLSTEYDFLHVEIKRVIDERYFNNAQNINLDIIGSIIGVGREVTDFVETDYFSFLQDPTGKGFGSLTEKVVAGRYRSADENAVTTRKLIDSEYRILINAKILKNISNITSNDVLLITRQILELMYPNITINVDIAETGNASFQVKINYILTPAEKSFIASLDLIPRPVGVRIEYVYEDIDIDLDTELNTLLGDTISSMVAGLTIEGLISVAHEDVSTSLNVEVIENISLDLVLEDSIVDIQVAPPGTFNLILALEDSVVSINSTVEQDATLSIIDSDTIVSISTSVVSDADLIIALADTIVTGELNVSAILDSSGNVITNADGSDWEIE